MKDTWIARDILDLLLLQFAIINNIISTDMNRKPAYIHFKTLAYHNTVFTSNNE